MSWYQHDKSRIDTISVLFQLNAYTHNYYKLKLKTL